jgi:hypothetical protein
MEKFSAWRTVDGKLFAEEQDAKDHEFAVALDAWVEATFSPEIHTVDDARAERSFDNLLGLLKADRMKMLPIFKLLNGTGGPIAPPVQPTDHQAMAAVASRLDFKV